DFTEINDVVTSVFLVEIQGGISSALNQVKHIGASARLSQIGVQIAEKVGKPILYQITVCQAGVGVCSHFWAIIENGIVQVQCSIVGRFLPASIIRCQDSLNKS